MTKSQGIGLLLIWAGLFFIAAALLFSFGPQLLAGNQHCPVSEGSPTPCIVGGQDIGGLLYDSFVFSIVAYILVIPFSIILIAIGDLILGFDAVQRYRRKQSIDKRILGSALVGLLCIVACSYLLYYAPQKARDIEVYGSDSGYEDKTITINFKPEATKEEVDSLAAAFQEEFNISNIKYQTPEQRLDLFKKRHANDSLTLQAIEDAEGPLFGYQIEFKTESEPQHQEILGWIQFRLEYNSIEGIR